MLYPTKKSKKNQKFPNKTQKKKSKNSKKIKKRNKKKMYHRYSFHLILNLSFPDVALPYFQIHFNYFNRRFL